MNFVFRTAVFGFSAAATMASAQLGGWTRTGYVLHDPQTGWSERTYPSGQQGVYHPTLSRDSFYYNNLTNLSSSGTAESTGRTWRFASSASASQWAGGGHDGVDASAEAGFYENSTISNPDLVGQAGTFRAKIHIHAYLEAHIAGAASADCHLQIYRHNTTSWALLTYMSGNAGFTDRTYSEDVELLFNFTYGTPFSWTVAVSGISYAAAMHGGTSSSKTNGYNTVTWQGITGVFDANGQEVTNYTMTSATGTNWVEPVPEPASLAALTLGGVALLARRRARKSPDGR